MEETKYERIAQDDEEIEKDETEKKDEGLLIDVINEEETSQENVSKSEENCKCDKHWEEEMRSKTIGLTEKKLLLRKLVKEGNKGERKMKWKEVSQFKVFSSGIAVKLNKFYVSSKVELQSWGLWKGHLKSIGGRFGNGVLSYFTFLRWLFYLNIGISLLALTFIIIPTLSFKPILCKDQNITETSDLISNQTLANQTLALYNVQSCSYIVGLKTSKYNFNEDNLQNVIDFFQGTGWLNTTVAFYARYENAFLFAFGAWVYNFPLAYLLTSLSCLLVSLYLITSTAIDIFEEGYIKGGVSNASSFSNMVFGSWDMCIMNKETASLTSASIAKELEAAVEELKRKSKKEKRTKREKYCLTFVRFVVNIIIVIMLVAGALAIYQATIWSFEDAKTRKSEQNFRTMLTNYVSPITITLVNTILPALFYKLSDFEDLNPRVKVNWDLGRTVLVKLSSICVLVITIFHRNKGDDTTFWENFLAAELYKLIWMDFITSCSVTMLVEFPRGYIGRNVDAGCKLNEKIGIPEFHIPTNVLDLIYGQTIIWIGTLYSPSLPLMQCVNLFLLFYIKKISLLHNFDPPQKPYRSGKSNYFFMILQLLALALSMVATVYAVTQITPSRTQGPFSGFHKMYDIITLTINDLPGIYKSIISIIFSTCVIISIFIGLCLMLYFYRSMYRVYSKSANQLRLQLKSEQQEKKILLAKFKHENSKEKLDMHERKKEVGEYDHETEKDENDEEIKALEEAPSEGRKQKPLE